MEGACCVPSAWELFEVSLGCHLDSEAMRGVRMVRKQHVSRAQISVENPMAVQVLQALSKLQGSGKDDG